MFDALIRPHPGPLPPGGGETGGAGERAGNAGVVLRSSKCGIRSSMFHVRCSMLLDVGCWMFDALIRPHPGPLSPGEGGNGRRQEASRKRRLCPSQQQVRYPKFNVQCSTFDVRCSWMLVVGCSMH